MLVNLNGNILFQSNINSIKNGNVFENTNTLQTKVCLQ